MTTGPSTPPSAADDGKMIHARREAAAMATHLFEAVGIPFEQSTELQRQILAAFAFGMVYAAGQRAKFSPPEVNAVVIAMLMDAFGYAPQQAAAFAHDLILATSPAHHPTMNAIIHRGIDGQAQWDSGDRGRLRANVTEVVRTVCGGWPVQPP